MTATTAPRTTRSAGAFTTVRARRRYIVVLVVLGVLALGSAFGLLAWDNPLPVGTPGSGASPSTARPPWS